MASKLAFKVSFRGDVRKITSCPEELHMAIAERYGLSQEDTGRIRLFHQDQPVDIGWIVALTSTLEPGKPLKLSMDIVRLMASMMPSGMTCSMPPSRRRKLHHPLIIS